MTKKIENVLLQILAWTVLLSTAACAVHSVPYVVLENGIDSGLPSKGPHFDVITDSVRFQNAFRILHSNQLPAPVPPQVEFEHSLVILASLEHQPTAGYHLRIKRVSQSQRTLQVELLIERPDPGRVLPAVVTRPYIMIRVQKNAFDTVQFVGEQHTVLQTVSLKGDGTQAK
jgi:hypothetical protein